MPYTGRDDPGTVQRVPRTCGYPAKRYDRIGPVGTSTIVPPITSTKPAKTSRRTRPGTPVTTAAKPITGYIRCGLRGSRHDSQAPKSATMGYTAQFETQIYVTLGSLCLPRYRFRICAPPPNPEVHVSPGVRLGGDVKEVASVDSSCHHPQHRQQPDPAADAQAPGDQCPRVAEGRASPAGRAGLQQGAEHL